MPTYSLRYLLYLLVGIALLWPWNCFLSALAYFTDRFGSIPVLADTYLSTMMTVSTLTLMVGNFVLAQRQTTHYGRRLVMGQLVTVVVFVVMLLLCVLFLDASPALVYALVMAMVFVSAIATCVSQNGTMALVVVSGPMYANAVQVGQAVAGVLPSIALIILVVLSQGRVRTTAAQADWGLFWYFFASSILSAAAVVLFRAAQRELHTPLEDDPTPTPPPVGEPRHVPLTYLWQRLAPVVSTIFLTFAVTLAFPVFALTVELVHRPRGVYAKPVYIPLVYLVWNAGDLAGRLCCAHPLFVVRDRRQLVGYAVARLLFVPVFFLCNVKNRGATIRLDAFYLLLQFAFGASNGQLASSCFMTIGDDLDLDQEKAAAGGFTTIFLSSGLAAGAVLSYGLVYIIG